MPKPNRVFISHSTKDRDFVEQEIVRLLESHGVKVWYSRDDIQTASQWQDSILDGLEQSDWFLAVLSPRSVCSRWVRAEVDWAMENRSGEFLPVLMEDCDRDRLNLTLRNIQHVDFRRKHDEARRRLLKTWGVDFAPTEFVERTVSLKSSTKSQKPPQGTRARLKKPTAYAKAEVAKPLETVTTSTGMKLGLILAGEFVMGSPDSDTSALEHEKPQHRVKISKPFYLGLEPVTQAAYKALIGNTRSDREHVLPYLEGISWLEAISFCNQLSRRERLPSFYKIKREQVSIVGGNGYRLPTEAEWEYACRAHTSTKWSFGDDVSKLSQYAWYVNYIKNPFELSKPISQKLRPLPSFKRKKPNPWGFFDMHGSVGEWCWDWFGPYGSASLTDPSGPLNGELRVARGGSIDDPSKNCRSASRDMHKPTLPVPWVGFRIARTCTSFPLPSRQ